MESPCSSFSLSKVADDTRMYCCSVDDIVNLENSLKTCESGEYERNDVIVTSLLGRDLGH